MIVESIVQVILHCSRCNARFREDANDEWNDLCHWDSREDIAEQFNKGFGEYGGWRRFGDRYVCGGCQISNGYADDPDAREAPEPLPSAEADKVARAQAGYARDDKHIVEIGTFSWTLSHPLTCRPNLFDCEVNKAAEGHWLEIPDEVGRFLCELDKDGRFVVQQRINEEVS